MDFAALLQDFAAAVEAGDGRRLGALFSEDGIYHDTFYGRFQGPVAIGNMLERYFHRDGTRFRWAFRDPVCDGRLGYARWRFSYSSKLQESVGRRVAVEGMSCFELAGERIRRYNERFDAGVALSQLGFPPDRMAKLLRRWAEEQAAEPGLHSHLHP